MPAPSMMVRAFWPSSSLTGAVGSESADFLVESPSVQCRVLNAVGFCESHDVDACHLGHFKNVEKGTTIFRLPLETGVRGSVLALLDGLFR